MLPTKSHPRASFYRRIDYAEAGIPERKPRQLGRQGPGDGFESRDEREGRVVIGTLGGPQDLCSAQGRRNPWKERMEVQSGLQERKAPRLSGTERRE